MNVVLSGYYGFHNVGDEAILYAIIQALRAHDPNVQVTVLSNDPAFTEKTYGVHAVNRWRIGDIVQALRHSDGLISGGGSLLQDQTGWRSIPYYTGIMQVAKWLGKPVIVYAQGMGPVNKKQNQWLMKWTLNRVDRLTVRDEPSAELLKMLGVKKPMTVVPDPVMGLEPPTSPTAWWEAQSFTRPVIAVSVRDWARGRDFERKIAVALDRSVQAGFDVVFIPMHGHHDDQTSRRVLTMMKEHAFVAPYDASIQEKMAMIASSHLLVGMRLHALIFAAVGHTPFIALSYDPKIDAFSSQANQPVFAHVEDDRWDGEALFSYIQQCMAGREEQKEAMIRAVASLKRTAQQTAKEALALFRNKN
ncbi:MULTISPECIES: polysaccharide pyruvyl transferase CsaB [Anoxybacillus]|nr:MULTISPECIES: polysaccharide pyruvyl transferase CsaB [Anoxybacillus]KFZ42303.1 CsaB protein [Anoxybacillus sp. KU2-6(11)]